MRWIDATHNKTNFSTLSLDQKRKALRVRRNVNAKEATLVKMVNQEKGFAWNKKFIPYRLQGTWNQKVYTYGQIGSPVNYKLLYLKDPFNYTFEVYNNILTKGEQDKVKRIHRAQLSREKWERDQVIRQSQKMHKDAYTPERDRIRKGREKDLFMFKMRSKEIADKKRREREEKDHDDWSKMLNDAYHKWID